jgi:hypothetical protein
MKNIIKLCHLPNINSWAKWTLLATFILMAIVLSNIQQPPIDLHDFRQCQTGITAYWFNWRVPFESFFNYETPEFGVPWKAPFELPLYQAVVSALSHVAGVSIHVAGRITSLFFFFGTLWPLAVLTKGMGLGLRCFFFSAVFWLCSPLYLYWSRTVMIESTAVFFGFVFLASLERAMATRNWYWWITAFVTSLACALVKVTSYPPFGLAALGILFWQKAPSSLKQIGAKEILQSILPSLLIIAFIGLCTVATTLVWNHHMDSIKLQNTITQSLTSKNLSEWNFGTIAQKTDLENWRKLFDRSIPEAIGGYWVLGFLFGSGCFLKGKRIILLVGLLFLFVLPFAIFTNLHLVHNYYQYANSLWLVLALGLTVSEMSKYVPRYLSCVVVLLILGAQLQTYSRSYYQFTQILWSDALEAAKYVEANSKSDECILVIGDDWSPEVAFLSKRRALYIPKWLPHEHASALFQKIRENPSTIFGSHAPALLIVNARGLASYPPKLRYAIEQLLLQMGQSQNSKRVQVREYELMKIRMDDNRLQIDEKGLRIDLKELGIDIIQSIKPEINTGKTKTIYESILQNSLGNMYGIKFSPGGIFMHPGGQPTKATFNISGKLNMCQLVGYIAELPVDALEDPLAGMVEMEVFVDGKSEGRRIVDRFTNQSYNLDLTNAKKLKVIVDCANGTAIWDHFYLGIANDSPKQ